MFIALIRSQYFFVYFDDVLIFLSGLPNRLLSYERFLELYPEYIEKVILLQVAVPSRTDVKEYNGKTNLKNIDIIYVLNILV